MRWRGLVLGWFISSGVLGLSPARAASTPDSMNVALRLSNIRADKSIPIDWKYEAQWVFRLESGQPALHIRFGLELPASLGVTGIKSALPEGTKLQFTKEGKPRLTGFLVARETSLKLTLSKGEWIGLIAVEPLTNPLILDRSCLRQGMTFERVRAGTPTGDFAGAICSKEKNLVKLVVSTGKDVAWAGSSLFEHEGKGERWKVFKVDVESAVSESAEAGAGTFAWGPDGKSIEYRMVIASSGSIGKGVREAVRAEVALAGTQYSVTKANRGTAEVKSVTAPIVVYVSPWKGRFNLLVRWLGTITSLPQDAQNSVSEWAVGAGFELGKRFLIMPSVEYLGALFSSHELTVSTTFQGPGGKLLFVFNIFKGASTMLGVGYAAGAEAETQATLMEGLLKQNLSLGGRTFSLGARYQQEKVNLNSGSITTTLISAEVGTQF